MKTLKLIAAGCLLALTTQNALAQDQKPRLNPEQKQEMKAQFEKDKARLQLSPEQETKMKEINQKYAGEMKGMRDKARSEKRQQGQEMRERRNAEVKAVLSESQYKTFLQLQDERKARFKEKRQKPE